MNDLQALRDQYVAFVRDWAEGCKEIHDQYIRAGFTRPEAMELLHRHLDDLEPCDAST